MISSNQFLRLSVSAVSVFAIVCFVVATAFAQEKNPQRGFQPGNSYAISDIESINTTNGNLILHIPLGQLPPGRGGLSAGISLRYNSKQYDSKVVNDLSTPSGQTGPQNTIVRSTEGGWSYGFNYSLEIINRHNLDGGPFQCQGQQAIEDAKAYYIWKVRLVYPDGGAHEFRPDGYSDFLGDGYFAVNPITGEIRNCTSTVGSAPNPLTYFSTDGTYTRLTIDRARGWTVSFPDGSRVVNDTGALQGLTSFSNKLYDRNNNYITLSTGVADQFNRSVTFEHNSSPSPSPSPSGSPSPPIDEDYIVASGFKNKTLKWTVKWKLIYVTRPYTTTAAGANSFGLEVTTNQTFQGYERVVDSITLPSELGALSYKFSYNAPDYLSGSAYPTTASPGWGEISGIRLPSGATVAYEYSTDGDFGQTTRLVLDSSLTKKSLTYKPEYDVTSDSGTDACVAGCTTDTWLYGVSSTLSTIVGPDGGRTQSFYNDTTIQSSSSGLVYKEVHSDGEVIERLWQPNAPHRVTFTNDTGANYFVKAEFRSLPDSSGRLVKTAIKGFTYDKNGNVTSVAEYDWVDYSKVDRVAERPTGIPVEATLKRTTTNKYARSTPDASDSASDTADSYWKSTSVNLRNAIISTEVREGTGSGATSRARTEFVYDNATTTGNLTKKTSWDSTKGVYSNPLTTGTTGNSISVSTEYDQYGNPTMTTDARDNRTQLYYGTVGAFSDLYPTQIKTAYLTSVQRTETRDYDFSTGLVKLITDVDNSVSTSTDYDDIGRPILVKAAMSKPEESDTATTYSDVNRRVIVRSDLFEVGDGKLVTIDNYDQLGRIRLTRHLENATTADETDETKGIKVQTRYLFSDTNSYQLVSNPYRATTSAGAGSEESMGSKGWTRSKRDNGGRTIEVQSFDGAGLPAPWGDNSIGTGTVTTAYDANSITVTDQAGKKRRSVTDGLGRLIRVDEPDTSGNLVQPTSYTYDVLDDLTGVTQGVQTRTFTYGSLKRLVSATNPESGTICYGTILNGQCQGDGYDANGNLTTKTDARNIVTSYGPYDELNRLQRRTYNDGTPTVTYTYDTATSGRGRLGSITNGISSYNYTYDALGRVLGGEQVTDQTSYPVGYQYNRAGEITSETYPSGKVIATNYDNAGRVAGVKNLTNNFYYAGGSPAPSDQTCSSCILYTAHGAISDLRLGNSLWEHSKFNSRMQPTEIGLGTTQGGVDRLQLTYDYGSTDNNGNVKSQIITFPGLNASQAYTQSYNYDSLNRLASAQEISGSTTTWNQVYKYDQFGNRTFDTGTTLPALPSSLIDMVNNPKIDSATNRLVKDQDGDSRLDYDYDAAGNVKRDALGRTFAYDAENKQKSFNGEANTGGASYVYDGDGKRVKKVTSSETTIFVYDVMGHLIAEYNNATQPSSGGISYLTADTLGTPRIVTGATGNVIARHDYLPFGEELAFQGSTPSVRTSAQMYVADNLRQKFTGKERDSETGLDWFGARYMSSAQGRFTSPDKPFADQKVQDPQSWNLYTYVRNNPVKYIDENGRELKIAIYNNSGLSRDVVTQVAQRIVATFSQNGLKNVTFEIHDGIPPALTLINQQLNPRMGHSEILELRQGRQASSWAGQNIPAGEGGHNNYGDAAVATSVVTSMTQDQDQTTVGVANLSTHELAHEALGHRDEPTNIMNSEGAADPKWIFNPNLSFTQRQSQLLQQKYNRPGEVDRATNPPEKKKDEQND